MLAGEKAERSWVAAGLRPKLDGILLAPTLCVTGTDQHLSRILAVKTDRGEGIAQAFLAAWSDHHAGDAFPAASGKPDAAQMSKGFEVFHIGGDRVAYLT